MLNTAPYRDEAGSTQQTLMAIQHREILDLFDEAFRLYKENSASAMLVASIDRIYARVQAHFQDEELLESQPEDYSNYEHRETHRRMLVQIGSICQSAECFDREDAFRQLHRVNEWLQEHISEEAPEYARVRYEAFRLPRTANIQR